HELIFPIIIIALVIALIKKMDIKPMVGLLILNILFSAIYASWYWEGTRILKDNFMIFNTFNFSRIHFLKPLIWYILFALALFIIWKTFKILGLFFLFFLLVSYIHCFSIPNKLSIQSLINQHSKNFIL